MDEVGGTGEVGIVMGGEMDEKGGGGGGSVCGLVSETRTRTADTLPATSHCY